MQININKRYVGVKRRKKTQTLGLPRMHSSASTRLRASRLLAPVADAGAM